VYTGGCGNCPGFREKAIGGEVADEGGIGYSGVGGDVKRRKWTRCGDLEECGIG